jgi:outer membrane protein assembly factor BamB
MEINATGYPSTDLPVSQRRKKRSSPSRGGAKDSFTAGTQQASAAPGPEFFRALQAGTGVSPAASLVFDDPLAHVKKIPTDVGHPCGAPFTTADGTVIVTSPWEFMTVDSREFSVTKTVKYPMEQESITFDAPAFKEDGTFYALTQDRKHIRGIKEGVEVLNIDTGDTIATPLALSGSKLAYCTRDGMLKLIGLDGRVKRKKKIPMAPTKEAYHQDGPIAVQFGKNGSIYVQTGDDRVISYGPRGLWSTTIPRTAHYPQAMRIEESDDGSTLYLGGAKGVIAIDAASGKEKWNCDLGDASAIAPIHDSAGTLYGLTKKGTIALISPEGKVERSFSTGEECDTVNQSCPRLRVDGHGNICVTPNCGKFQIFDRSGFRLLTIEKNKLFREVDYLHDFILSGDGMRAFLIPGTGSFAEITLPLSIAERAASCGSTPSAGEEASPGVIKDDDFVWIDGIRLQRQGHAARFPL